MMDNIGYKVGFWSLIFLAGLLIGISMSFREHNKTIDDAIRSGRLSGPNGIYYVIPAPTFDEMEQLRSDNAFLNKQLNKKAKR